MLKRQEIIEDLLQSMHAMRLKLMVGYSAKKEMLITPSQGFVLRFVAENKDVNVKAIARALHISSSAATQLIDGLVDKGYLVRTDNPADRRAITLSLSTKAKKLFKEFKKQGLQKMMQLFSILTDAELAQYASLNKKITSNLTNKYE
jgi:DNA-binding MarR family transcriptional regulator